MMFYWDDQKMQRRFNRARRTARNITNAYSSGYRFNSFDKMMMLSYGLYETFGFLNDLFNNGSYRWLGRLF